MQYGRKDIEKSQRTSIRNKENDDDDELTKLTPKISPTTTTNNVKHMNGNVPNGELISRDDKLILVPEPPKINNENTIENKTEIDEEVVGDGEVI